MLIRNASMKSWLNRAANFASQSRAFQFRSHSKMPLPLLLCAALSFLTSACGRSNAVLLEAQAPGEVQPVSTDGRSTLPKDFYDQSVNSASVRVGLDGVTDSSKALQFRILGGTHAAGAFNGSGTGNRAILAIGKFSRTRLADLGEISFDAKVTSGSEQIDVQLQLDLNCDGQYLEVVRAKASDLGAGLNVGNGYTRYSIDALQNNWTAVDGDLVDPVSPGVTMLFMLGAPQSLSNILASYPHTCIRNAATGALGLPASLPTGGVQLVMGESHTTAAGNAFVRRVKIGLSIFETWE
ncbi:MAG TPA: hypothetical protein PLZ57_14425 [Pseudobdellovibrionaceae bacterium]|nr:hypothetical protein [Pseudobdellovibrionaceae bacterium]